MKKENGITLIALVITIIVLLILAGVTIVTLTGDNGLITKASDAKKTQSDAEIEEQIKLAYAEYQTEKYMGNSEDAAIFMQTKLRTSLKDNGLTVTGSFKITLSNGKEYFYNAKTGEMVNTEVDLYPTIEISTNNEPVIENSKYVSGSYTAVIPTGYSISNDISEQSIENGLVIKKDENEWVWIPVSSSDLALMYTEDSTGWTMSGTNVVTKYKSLGNIVSNRNGLMRGNPGTTDWREPDVINSTSYDNKNTNWRTAGFSSYKNMAESLRDDYKNMINSIKKYGGFYIGRYELSQAGTKKNQDSLTNIDWYNLYAKCKTLGSNSTESRMIWGCQWDQACKFISTVGDKVDLSDSSSYANYSYTTGNANITGKGAKQVTGFSIYWGANNIYDIAGNCHEWTQEAFDVGTRSCRGGYWLDAGISTTVSSRGGFQPTTTSNSLTSRPILYIK